MLACISLLGLDQKQSTKPEQRSCSSRRNFDKTQVSEPVLTVAYADLSCQGSPLLPFLSFFPSPRTTFNITFSFVFTFLAHHKNEVKVTEEEEAIREKRLSDVNKQYNATLTLTAW